MYMRGGDSESVPNVPDTSSAKLALWRTHRQRQIKCLSFNALVPKPPNGTHNNLSIQEAPLTLEEISQYWPAIWASPGRASAVRCGGTWWR